MHIVRDAGENYILVGLGTVISTEGFANDNIGIGDKVRIVCSPHELPRWVDTMSIRAFGFEGTWGTAEKHYKLDYLYPYVRQ